MKIFGGSASRLLAEKVAASLDAVVSYPDIHIFPDGERRIRVTEKVVGEECIVVQTACPPVDTNYMELLFLVDALKRSGAEHVTAVVPYFGYQRQDHVFREGEAVSLEVIIRILESLKVDRLISVDMHTPKIPQLFHIPVSHLSALPLFVQHIKQNNWNTEDTVLVSPDRGGVGRITNIVGLLGGGLDFAVVEKKRDLETGEITVSSLHEGSVSGKKRAILIDDMIASGHTIVLAASYLKKQGIEEVIVFTTHAVFSEDAPKLLQDSSVDTVLVTDTVEVPEEKRFPKLSIISLAPLVASDLKSPIDSNSPLLSL